MRRCQAISSPAASTLNQLTAEKLLEQIINRTGDPRDHPDPARSKHVFEYVLNTSANDGLDFLVSKETDSVKRFSAGEPKVHPACDPTVVDREQRHGRAVLEARRHSLSHVRNGNFQSPVSRFTLRELGKGRAKQRAKVRLPLSA